MREYEISGFYEVGRGVAEIQGTIKINDKGYFNEEIQILNGKLENKIIKGYLIEEINTNKLLFAMKDTNTKKHEMQEQQLYNLTKLKSNTLDGYYRGTTYKTQNKNTNPTIRDLEDEVNWIDGKTYIEHIAEINLNEKKIILKKQTTTKNYTTQKK